MIRIIEKLIDNPRAMKVLQLIIVITIISAFAILLLILLK